MIIVSMNVLPQSENIGSTVHVKAPRGGHGVTIQSDKNDNVCSGSEDEDEEFMALMNETKRKTSSKNESVAFQGDAGLPGGFQSNDHSDFQHPSMSESPRVNTFERPAERPYERPAERPYVREHSSYERAAEQANSFRSLEEEKQHFLYKIQRLQNKYPGRRVGIDTPLDELKYEYERLVRQSELSASIKFQRRTLMATVSGIEYLNKSFNPLGLHLDGWSEQVMDSLEDFDQSFEQLHEKYQGSAEVSPEWNILITLLGSGFMFHLSNSLFKSVLPNVNDVAKNNPDLMSQIASAMSSAMNGQTTSQAASQPAGESTSQLGASLAMQAMQQKLRPSDEEFETFTESDQVQGFEQASALRKPLPPMARPVPQQSIEEISDESVVSDASSDLSMSDEGDVRRVAQVPKRAVSNGRKQSSKKAKNSVNISL